MQLFHGGTPPEPTAGNTSPYTTRLRPRIGLDPDRCLEARRLKRQDPTLSAMEIAVRLGEGATEAAVVLALATLRTKNPRRTRATANLTLEAAAFLQAERREGERVWQTADRLFGELVQLRAIVAGLSRRAP